MAQPRRLSGKPAIKAAPTDEKTLGKHLRKTGISFNSQIRQMQVRLWE